MATKLYYLAALAATLTACGGGDDSSNDFTPTPNAATTPAALSVFITDDISTQYRKVWVSVTQVTAVDSGGAEQTLYQDAAGKVFNLPELDAVGALLNTAPLAAGDYQSLNITVANTVELVNSNGLTMTARFNDAGTPQVINVTADFTVTDGQSSAIALDFDLKQFNYDATTGIVSPVIVFQNETQVKELERRYAKLEGAVSAITDASHFTLRSTARAPLITVTLAPNVTVVNELTRIIAADTSALAVDDRVDVYGNYDSSTLTLSAVSIRIDNDSSNNLTARDKAEGMVTSYDGSTLVLDVREANFIPGNNTLNVVNVSNALFTKGNLVTLQAGMQVEIRGHWDGSLLNAKIVEIEGAAPATGLGAGAEDYAEVQGLITAHEGDILTLQVMKTERANIAIGSSLSVDIANAWLKTGSDACLIDGAYVEIKGAMNNAGNDGFIGRTIEIEGGCGTASANDPSTGHDDSSSVNDTGDDDSSGVNDAGDNDFSDVSDGGDDDSSGVTDTGDDTDSSAQVEVKGVVTALTDDLVTLRIIKAEGFLPAGDTVTADIVDAWYENGDRARLGVNSLVEIKGTWSSDQVVASKVEFEW